MAKKFRCSTCGSIVAIDPSLEVIACPHCGKKYRNIFYDPTAQRSYVAAPVETPSVEDRPATEAVAEQPETAVETEEVVTAEEEGEYEEGEYEADEYETEAYTKKVAKLKAKKSGHAAVLVFSLLLMAAVALLLYFHKENYTQLFNMFKADWKGTLAGNDLDPILGLHAYFWTVILAYMPIALVALGTLILAATNINVATIKLKALDSDDDMSKKLASARKAGYAFCLIFSLLTLIYGGLMSIGGFAMDMASGGTAPMELVEQYFATDFRLVYFLLGVIGTAYFSHRINIAGKKFN